MKHNESNDVSKSNTKDNDEKAFLSDIDSSSGSGSNEVSQIYVYWTGRIMCPVFRERDPSPNQSMLLPLDQISQRIQK